MGAVLVSLFGKPAGREVLCVPESHLAWVWMLVAFIKQRVRGEEVKFKKVIVVSNISWFQPDSGRDVLTALFWQSFTGGPW